MSKHGHSGLSGWARGVYASARDRVGGVGTRVERTRKRHRLSGARKRGIEDLGGLALEMARRDRFSPDLIRERAGTVLSIERELRSLSPPGSSAAPLEAGAEACRCGAPLPAGAVFCPRCGRPVPDVTPGSSCSRCGQPLPADANFCGYCGTSHAAVELRVADDR